MSRLAHASQPDAASAAFLHFPGDAHARYRLSGISRRSPVVGARSGTVLAFDFGEKRIGAAVGDFAVRIAHPLTSIAAESKKRRYAALETLVREWQPSVLVVGLPAHMDGSEHEISRLARKFARELGDRFHVPVELVDERLTSVEAESSLGNAGIGPRRRKGLIDQVAAQHILQAFFDTRN